MTDDQKFLFDLTGYLVIKGALTADQVDRCNEAVDRHMDKLGVANPERVLSEDSKTLAGPAKQHYLGKCLQWQRPWCEPFRDVLVNPHIASCLNVILQKGYRLDGRGALLVVADAGAEGLVLHGGGAEAPTSMGYFCKNGIFYCGMTVVEVLLADEGPGGSEGGERRTFRSGRAIPHRRRDHARRDHPSRHRSGVSHHQEARRRLLHSLEQSLHDNRPEVHGRLDRTGGHAQGNVASLRPLRPRDVPQPHVREDQHRL